MASTVLPAPDAFARLLDESVKPSVIVQVLDVLRFTVTPDLRQRTREDRAGVDESAYDLVVSNGKQYVRAPCGAFARASAQNARELRAWPCRFVLAEPWLTCSVACFFFLCSLLLLCLQRDWPVCARGARCHVQMKVMLSTKLNGLVLQGAICRGAYLRISGVRLHIDETRVEVTDPMVIVTLASVLSVAPVFCYGGAGMAGLKPLDAEADKERPLCGARMSYVGLYDSRACPWAASSSSDLAPEPDFVFDADAQCSLAEAISSFRLGAAGPPLVGMVTSISSLKYLADPDAASSFPFSWRFDLEDVSARIEVIVWDSMCKTLFRSLHLGSVIRINNYKVRASFSKRGRYELTLNARNPSAHVVLLPDAMRAAYRNVTTMPPLSRILPLAMLRTVPDGELFDFVGVVVCLGRTERLALDITPDGSGRTTLATYRWVGFRDEKNARELPVQVFVNSAITEDAINSLTLGDVVLFNELRVVSALLESFRGRFIMATTTAVTHMFVEDADCPWASERRAALLELPRARRLPFLSRLSIGYRRWFPHVGESVAEFQRLRPNVRNITMLDLLTGRHSLALLEQRISIVRGVVVSVRAVRLEPIAAKRSAPLDAEQPARKKQRTASAAAAASAAASASDAAAADDEVESAAPAPAARRVVLGEAVLRPTPTNSDLQTVETTCFIPLGGSGADSTPRVASPVFWELTLTDANASALTTAVIYPFYSVNTAQSRAGSASPEKLPQLAVAPDGRVLRNSMVNSFFELKNELPEPDDDADIPSLVQAVAELFKDPATKFFFVLEMHRGRPASENDEGIEIAVSSVHFAEPRP